MSAESPRQEADSGNGSDVDNSTECPTCGRSDFANRRGMKVHHKKIHNESLKFTISCDWCGESYAQSKSVAEDNENNFCGDECRAEWLSKSQSGESNPLWVDNVKTECKNCSKVFKHKPYIDRTFCGKECRDSYEHGEESNFWKGGKETLTCVECGDEFQVHPSKANKRNRCSQECINGTVVLDCEWCGEPFEAYNSAKDRRRCCSRSCWASLRASFPAEEQPNYRGGHEEYNYGDNWYSQRRKARKRDQYSCSICGRDERQLGKIPSCHHIQKLRYYRENYDAPDWYERGNRLDNLILLCEEHHKKWEGIPLRPQT